jgi:hypothetical protein
VARIYAGVLGPLAFLIVLARGILGGGGTETVLYRAWCSLLVFAIVGGAIGWFAQRTVEDSVHGRIAAELAARNSTQASQPAASGRGGA